MSAGRALLLVALGLLGCAPAAGALSFSRCGKARCARVTVPLDYGDPAGPTASIAVARLPARDKTRRIGALFVNYGGPGAGAVRSLARNGTETFRRYLDRFDIVAVDPRGTGRSSPRVDCRVSQERAGIYRQPFVTASTFHEPAELGRARRYANRCASLNAAIAPHLSTANVARDFDAVRAALGEERITYFGFSYGTLLGATYAALFGDHVRAMVLDGALDPNVYLNDPMRDLREQTDGFETALDRYLADCARHRRRCRWPGATSPRAAYDRLVRRASRHPIPARIARHRPVDGDDVNMAVSSDLYVKQLWPEVTRALREASRGDASLLRAIADDGYGRRRHGGYDPGLDRYFTIGASEQQYPRDLQPYRDAGAGAAVADPHFFFNRGYTELNYAVYAPRDEDAFLGPFTLAAGVPAPLVVGTTHDPATPYAQAQGLVTALGHARLLTMDGDGHTAYGDNSRCIDRAVDAYVLRLRLPREGKRCRQHVGFTRPAAKASTATFRPILRTRPGR